MRAYLSGGRGPGERIGTKGQNSTFIFHLVNNQIQNQLLVMSGLSKNNETFAVGFP